jgi:hypothetical protein
MVFNLFIWLIFYILDKGIPRDGDLILNNQAVCNPYCHILHIFFGYNPHIKGQDSSK